VPARRDLAPAALLAAVLLAPIACTGGDGDASEPVDTADTTSTSSTAPDLVIVEDVVSLGLDGIRTADGAVLLAYTDAERACIAAGASGVVAAPDDPDAEQVIAEAALGCLGFDRIAPLVTDQLAAEDDLAGVDPTCMAREVSSLQDTPDILAAILRGDPDTISVIARTASINCT
jgi:hypothetical protein